MKKLNQQLQQFGHYGNAVRNILLRKAPYVTYKLKTLMRCYANDYSPSQAAETIIKAYESKGTLVS